MRATEERRVVVYNGEGLLVILKTRSFSLLVGKCASIRTIQKKKKDSKKKKNDNTKFFHSIKIFRYSLQQLQCGAN